MNHDPVSGTRRHRFLGMIRTARRFHGRSVVITGSLVVRGCWFVSLSCLLFQAIPADAQTIRGVVLDAENDAPIAVAQVTLLNRSQNQLQTTVTDGEGRFSFELEHPGRYHLRASRIGYGEVVTEAFDVLAGEVVQVEVRISTRPIELPPLTVIGERPPRVLDPWLERGGYYEREARYRGSFGQFFGAEELEQIPARSVKHYFRMTPGVRTDYPGGRDMVLQNRSGCPVIFFLDGTLLRVDPDAIVTPSQIVAAEVYSRGIIPSAYAGRMPPRLDEDRRCRNPVVIALWTGFREP